MSRLVEMMMAMVRGEGWKVDVLCFHMIAPVYDVTSPPTHAQPQSIAKRIG